MFKQELSISKNKGTTLPELLIWVVIMFVLIGGINFVGYLTYNMTYSDGVKSGNLLKVTTKGIIFKTKEADINLGGFRKDSDGGMVPNVESYTILDDSIYNQLEFKMNNNMPVTVSYREVFHMPFWIGTGDRIIIKVH